MLSRGLKPLWTTQIVGVLDSSAVLENSLYILSFKIFASKEAESTYFAKGLSWILILKDPILEVLGEIWFP